LTTDQSPRLVAESVAAGAVGHLTKDRALTDVIGAVRRVARGDVLFSAAELRRAIREESPSRIGRC
jgi:DNA-binding NarL/FixJ family response regulator